MKISVKDVMTTQVVAVKLGASFKEMAARLRQDRVSAFPALGHDIVRRVRPRLLTRR
jgi:predicted transcriptional regulator